MPSPSRQDAAVLWMSGLNFAKFTRTCLAQIKAIQIARRRQETRVENIRRLSLRVLRGIAQIA